jgi:hypothetical protein
MGQVKSNQVVDNEVRKNPFVALPRDFVTLEKTEENSLVKEENNATNFLSDNKGVPKTPAIISVISQSANFNPDGTSVIDLVLEVEDVGTFEYEVRVTKDAGNI